MFKNFHDYIFRVKCNDGPSMTITLVAENYEKAVSYAKEYYAADHSIYADDRYNLWQIKSL